MYIHMYMRIYNYHILPASNNELECERLRGAVVEAEVALSGTGDDDVDVRQARRVGHPRRSDFKVGWKVKLLKRA